MNNQQDDQRCALCDELPQDILMLQCGHDLCVDCALKDYKSKLQNLFVCNICQKKTVLDKQTIKFLNAATQQKQAKMQKIVQKNTPKPKIPKQPKSTKKVCYEHKQQLIYYCFDCDSQNICSQCILSQKHTGHNVSTLKKAVQKLKDILISNLKQKQFSKTKLQNYQVTLFQSTSGFKSHIESKKKQIRYYFQSLKKVIQSQYERVIKQFAQTCSKVQNSLVGQINHCQNSIQEIKQQMEQLRKIINTNDDLSVLRKFQVKSIGDLNVKLDFIMPQLQYTDITSDLNKKLSMFSIIYQSSNINSQSRQQTPQQFHSQQYLHVPISNQIRFKNLNNSSSQSFKHSFVQTPLKPQMHRSINTASEIFNKLQSRQKNFD